MEKNDVASFFYYMWNCWSEEECKAAFSEPHCDSTHLWNKWCQYNGNNDIYGAVEQFFANLSDTNQDLLVDRALKMFNRKTRIR